MDGTKKTLYLGNVEIVVDAGVTTTKRMIAGVMLQAIVGSAVTSHYLFHDQLGSLVPEIRGQGKYQSEAGSMDDVSTFRGRPRGRHAGGLLRVRSTMAWNRKSPKARSCRRCMRTACRSSSLMPACSHSR
jgi:hypothetical protein